MIKLNKPEHYKEAIAMSEARIVLLVEEGDLFFLPYEWSGYCEFGREIISGVSFTAITVPAGRAWFTRNGKVCIRRRGLRDVILPSGQVISVNGSLNFHFCLQCLTMTRINEEGFWICSNPRHIFKGEHPLDEEFAV